MSKLAGTKATRVVVDDVGDILQIEAWKMPEGEHQDWPDDAWKVAMQSGVSSVLLDMRRAGEIVNPPQKVVTTIGDIIRDNATHHIVEMFNKGLRKALYVDGRKIDG